MSGIQKYRMYVDEVGNSDMGNTDNPNHRFLSLTGVIISLDFVKKILHPRLEELKGKFFDHHPDEPVILHRKELVNKKRPFEALRDENTCKQFDEELLILLQEFEYILITVVIDKYEHNERYSQWKYDPYHYCMKLLVERYVLFLERNNVIGDVMAESRGGKEDMRLKKSFLKVCEEGTEYVEPIRLLNVLTSKQLKVKPKANNVPGLQLADLLAHPSRREILLESNKMSDDRKVILGDMIIKIIQDKYDRVGDKVFGKKLLP